MRLSMMRRNEIVSTRGNRVIEGQSGCWNVRSLSLFSFRPLIVGLSPLVRKYDEVSPSRLRLVAAA